MKKVVIAVISLFIIALIGILAFLFFTSQDRYAETPLDTAKSAAANAALDASGIKDSLSAALEENRDVIAQATGMSAQEIDEAIANLDIANWEVITLPSQAVATGTYSGTFDAVDATITTYQESDYVTVNSYGQELTLLVPESAQSYLPYLTYL